MNLIQIDSIYIYTLESGSEAAPVQIERAVELDIIYDQILDFTWNNYKLGSAHKKSDFWITEYHSRSNFAISYKYRLNTENGGFMPDKSRGPKAPWDLSGVKPTFEVI